MIRPEYNKLREEIIKEAFEVSDAKGRDYTRSSEDVLANFKTVAERIGISPMKSLLVYMSKHSDAIENYIKNDGAFESEPIKGRIIDNINYLILLWCIINENTLGEIEGNETTEEDSRAIISETLGVRY